MTAAALAFAPAASLAPKPALLAELAGSTLDSLRHRMDEVVAAGRNPGPSLSTGVEGLDAELGGGIPRGRVTEITGALGAGKTALLRQVIARALAQGQWVAWIDARRTLAPAPWANLGKRFVVVRPKDVKRAAWSADLLLRSGVFSLVVLDGAPIVARSVGFRLAQIARERDAAFVVMSEEDKATRISGTLRLRVARGETTLADPPTLRRGWSARRRTGSEFAPPLSAQPTLTISSPKSGFSLEVVCAAPSFLARSLCAHPEIPDRRGVARGSRRPWSPKAGNNAHEQEQHAVSWGGLGAATVDHAAGRPGATGSEVYRPTGTSLRGNATGAVHGNTTNRDTTRPALRADGRPDDIRSRLSPTDVDRLQRETDRIAQHWSAFRRGRRRAAESTWGRPTRRERAREHTGAPLESHLGQGWGKLVGKGRVEPTRRDAVHNVSRESHSVARAPLGRVAEGVG